MYYVVAGQGIASFKITHKFKNEIYLEMVSELHNNVYHVNLPFDFLITEDGYGVYKISQDKFQKKVRMGEGIFKSFKQAQRYLAERQSIWEDYLNCHQNDY